MVCLTVGIFFSMRVFRVTKNFRHIFVCMGNSMGFVAYLEKGTECNCGEVAAKHSCIRKRNN